MRDSKRSSDVLPVLATSEDIKKSYGWLSNLYGSFEGIFEKGLRDRGLELLAVKEGETILEVGVGTGFSLLKIVKSVGRRGKAFGLDITREMLVLTSKRLNRAGLADRVNLCEGDARVLPYKNNTFDAVYMAATLELFSTPDMHRVLRETGRVLKLCGRLGVISMSKEGKEDSWFVRSYEWMHQRFKQYASCRPIYVEQAVMDAGFEVIKSQDYMVMKLVPMKLLLAESKL